MSNAIHRVFTILFAISFASASAFAAEPVVQGSDAKVARQKQAAGATPTTLDPVKDSPDGADGAGKGLDSVYNQILAEYNAVRAMWGVVVNDKAAPDITKLKEEYQNNRTACIDRQKYAAYACLENWSPAIQDGVAAVNTLMSTVGSAAVKDSCSNFAKAMDIAKYAMTAYTGACGTMKAGCGLSCVAARDALDSLYKKMYGNTVITCVNQTTCPADRTTYQNARAKLAQTLKQELDKGNNLSIAGKAEVCTGKYAQLAISAAAGIFGIAQSLKQGESCEEESSADASTAGATTAETCAVAANANLPECICLKNPMLEGCGSTAAKASMNASGGGLSALSAGSSEAGTDGLTAADLASGSTDPDISGARNPSSAASGAGAPVGGGGANLGGGSGFGGAGAAGEEKSGQKALDTNILGGAGGGGGGGGMWGGGGDADSDKSGYRSYLPGGAKDPLKMNGGTSNASKEVTGQGGKSNWEKVRERYQDNRSSLINN
ncbi:hypothetical protein [Bdellovibrio sp. HCB288]|uniref:hypothetical protein n=1 Tax=Bdellovibrio sp. HCB288 TaxID=3394355 RepID=UPI0039B6C41E